MSLAMTALTTREPLSSDEALALAGVTDTSALCEVAAELRDRGFGSVVTYSKKVFIPLTHLFFPSPG